MKKIEFTGTFYDKASGDVRFFVDYKVAEKVLGHDTVVTSVATIPGGRSAFFANKRPYRGGKLVIENGKLTAIEWAPMPEECVARI